MKVWQQILLASGGSAAVVLAVLRFAGDKLFSRVLDRRAFEHQTKFSHLHERRAEVIEELHKRIVRAQAGFSQLAEVPLGVGAFGAEMEFYASLGHISQFLESNRIFLAQKTCDDIDEFVKFLNSKGMFARSLLPQMRTGVTENEVQEFREARAKAAELKQKLEDAFRKMLGVR